jgi:hypothetical protein
MKYSEIGEPLTFKFHQYSGVISRDLEFYELLWNEYEADTASAIFG